MNRTRPIALGTLALLLAAAVAAEEPMLSPHQQLAEDILAELVAYRSSAAYPEETRKAIEATAARLVDAGFPAADVRVVHPEPQLTGLVARYRGTGEGRPLLVMAHMDVVPAEPAAWSFDPFTFAKRDGYYFGRGSEDNKAGVATLVADFIRLKREGFVPRRDLILEVTGDEETDGKVIEWMVTAGRDLIDAELALNTDAGGGMYDADGKPLIFSVQTSEKVYQSFRLTVSNPGGHSSLPRPDNAIYQLAAALTRLAAYRFPVTLNDGTRLYFERSADFQESGVAADMRALAAVPPNQDTAAVPPNQDAAAVPPNLAAAERLAARSPYFNSMLRTTCVATRLAAGTADNALPRKATALVNCRILPGVAVDEVEATLVRVLADDAVTLERVEVAHPSPPSPLAPEILSALEELASGMWPGVPVIPEMSTGATDGLFVRNAGIPVLGVSAIFGDPDDVRAHGLDERVGVKEFHDAVEFWYRMLKRLGG